MRTFAVTRPLALAALSVLLTGVALNAADQAASATVTVNHPDFGLSVPTLVNQSPSQQAASLATMRGIGVSWVRVDANWSWAQPTGPSTFDWSRLDREVGSMTAAGMHIDLIIDDTPAWARDPAVSGNWGQPASASAFATFAGQVAGRYGPRGVHTYEIWNEPNIHAFWNPAPNPSLYTTMLRDSSSAIKAAQPNATVLSGGLAPATNDGTNIAPVTFLEDMYADGAKGSFDALGYHAYSAPALPDTFETWSGWSQMNETNPSLRSVMTANGDAGKQIWITEVGAPSSGPGGVGTAAQAEEVTQAVQGAQANSWIGAEFFYTYQDAGTDPDYYGLLNADGSPKPAWAALARLLGGGSSSSIPGGTVTEVLVPAAVVLIGLVYVVTRRRRRARTRPGRTSINHRGRHQRSRRSWTGSGSSAPVTVENLLSGSSVGHSYAEPDGTWPVEQQSGQGPLT